MQKLQSVFLESIKAALRGARVEYEDLSKEDWQVLFGMAKTHRVLPLFLEAVYTPALQRTADPALLQQVRGAVRSEIMLQTMRTADFFALNRFMRNEGIAPIVVKGIVCRSLYPQPDHRPSSDEDLWVSPEDAARCHTVMERFSMYTEMDEPVRLAAYEIPYRRRQSPLYIELHKALFPPDSEAYGDLNRFFADAPLHAQTVLIDGEPVRTLCPTDFLFYLLCHAMKHFLHSGFGIRQLCDIVLYTEKYGAKIDWAEIMEHCRQIRAERFAAALFSIGIQYLGMDLDIMDRAFWAPFALDAEPLLQDLLDSGIYGDATMSRKHSSGMTLRAAKSRNGGKNRGSALLSAAFPPAKSLAGRYPYLKKHPYLVPMAWLHRMIKYRAETAAVKNNRASEAVSIGSRRIALLRQYGLID